MQGFLHQVAFVQAAFIEPQEDANFLAFAQRDVAQVEDLRNEANDDLGLRIARIDLDAIEYLCACSGAGQEQEGQQQESPKGWRSSKRRRSRGEVGCGLQFHLVYAVPFDPSGRWHPLDEQSLAPAL